MRMGRRCWRMETNWYFLRRIYVTFCNFQRGWRGVDIRHFSVLARLTLASHANLLYYINDAHGKHPVLSYFLAEHFFLLAFSMLVYNMLTTLKPFVSFKDNLKTHMRQSLSMRKKIIFPHVALNVIMKSEGNYFFRGQILDFLGKGSSVAVAGNPLEKMSQISCNSFSLLC